MIAQIRGQQVWGSSLFTADDDKKSLSGQLQRVSFRAMPFYFCSFGQLLLLIESRSSGGGEEPLALTSPVPGRHVLQKEGGGSEAGVGRGP